MIGGDRGAECSINPIRIGVKQLIASFVASPQINAFLLERNGLIRIFISFVYQLHVVGVIAYRFECLADGFERNIAVVFHLQSSFLTLLGGDKDYPVGG